jgi:hypothetical protein
LQPVVDATVTCWAAMFEVIVCVVLVLQDVWGVFEAMVPSSPW